VAKKKKKQSEEWSEQRSVFTDRTPIELRSVKLYDHPGFIYTTPSAITHDLSTKDKRNIGCYEKPKTKYCFKTDEGTSCSPTQKEAENAANGRDIFVKIEKSFTGSRCSSGKPNCDESELIYDERCKTPGKPCASDRATCPVQLVWVKGKPNLRFCTEKKKPGYLVPVTDVPSAMKLSAEACSKWPYQLGVQDKTEGSEEEGWDASFFDKNAKNIPKLAKAAYPKSKGLGEADFGRSALWLLGGATFAFIAAKMMKSKTA